MLIFFQKAVPATQDNVALSIAGYTTETVSHADNPAHYRRVEAVLTDTPTAGTLLVTLYKNGSALLDTIGLSPGHHRSSAPLDLPVSEGDTIEAKATSGSLAPTTADLLVIVS